MMHSYEEAIPSHYQDDRYGTKMDPEMGSERLQQQHSHLIAATFNTKYKDTEQNNKETTFNTPTPTHTQHLKTLRKEK